MIICGIDYSLTSPSICVHEGISWNHKNCKFYYLTHNKKNLVENNQFRGSLYEEYSCDTERYDNLSKWSSNIITSNNVSKCFIEGYAFNAVGRVFQIAENTGLLKYNIWKLGMIPQVFSPPMIKKFATNKGNSNKEALYESFFAETNIDIRKELDITNKNSWNPISDIVDAYYIAKLGFSTIIDS